MRVAALYDIHGMADALNAVLAEVEGGDVDAVVIGGDVALGPQPAETLALLRGAPLPVHWLRGNCDRMLGSDERDEELDWARGRLGPDDLAFLALHLRELAA